MATWSGCDPKRCGHHAPRAPGRRGKNGAQGFVGFARIAPQRQYGAMEHAENNVMTPLPDSALDFASDNASGASDKIMQALVAANSGSAPAYGADALTLEAQARISAVFERECAVFLVATGTASNALALSAICPPWGAIFAHEDAHVMGDECGAPEFFTAGAKLVGLAGEAGRVAPESLRDALGRFPRGLVKQVQPAALSLSQATECGALYGLDDIRALCSLAHEAGVRVHMDGARFANAVAALGCAPADMTWRAGVDVLSLGATKDGAFACEAVVFFDPALAADMAFRRKRGGHTLSKGRFLAAQMNAWLEDDHWLDLARAANARASELAQGLARIAGVRVAYDVQANEVFAVLPARVDAALKAAGARYYDWPARRLPASLALGREEKFVRLVASFTHKPQDVARFLSLAEMPNK
jgi:threonine aldolase